MKHSAPLAAIGLASITILCAAVLQAQEVAEPASAIAEPVFNIGEYDAKAEVINESVQGLIHLEEAPFYSEVIDIEIEDIGEIEHKFIMEANETLVYSWEVLDAKGDGVYYDFHGHPSSADAVNYPEGFEMAYSKGEGTTQSGSFTAPFAGFHGFYFMNIEEGPITVRLTVSGYWDAHKEMYRAVEGEVVHNEEF